MPRDPELTPARARAATKAAPAKKTKTPAPKVKPLARAAAKMSASKTPSAKTLSAEAFLARRQRATTHLVDMDAASVGSHLIATSHAYIRVLERALAARKPTADLTVPRLRALQVIAAHDGISGAEAGRALGVRPQTLTYLLKQLTGLEWITVGRTHGRALDYVLTPEGRKAVRNGTKVEARVEAALAQAYSHDGAEVQALVKLLTVGREHMAGAEATR